MPVNRSALFYFVAALAAIGCYDSPEVGEGGEEGAAGLLPSIEVVPTRLGAIPLAERLNGVVKSDNQVAIHAEISAPVAEVMVRSGAAVQRGQALIRLQDDLLQDQLRQAEASLRLARAEASGAKARVRELELQVQRTRILSAEKLIPELDLETQEAQLDALRAGAEQAEARVDAAQAEVEARQTAIDKTLIRAPVSGRVGRRNAEVGMLVDSGRVLFIIGSLDSLRVEIPITEAMLGYVREGQPVRVSALSLGEEVLDSTLSRISPFLSESSFSTTGEIDLLDAGEHLRPGMFVTVDILYGESEQAPLVPSSALWEDPRTGIVGVFVVSNCPAESPTSSGAQDESEGVECEVTFRAVEVIAEGRAVVAVRRLEEGERVVTAGKHLLRSDAPSRARVHMTTWERIVALQSLQREDLVRTFLQRQQEIARSRGATPPAQDEMRRRVLEGGEPNAAAEGNS